MRRALALLTLLAALAPGAARANGLTTHVWITLTAREHLPPGPLADLVTDPALTDALVSGTLFPDGGYAVGDGYGELAHWEPFQLGYLDWIRARFAPPWTDEARLHVAFLLGLASHGLADQVFDSLYMERARVHDHASDWANHSMDEATDVAMAAAVGAQAVPRRWVPVDALREVLAERRGHRVDEATVLRGQGLASFAVAVVGMLAADREAVRSYRARFPWATANLLVDGVPGAPPREAELVARYWAHLWGRLHGDPRPGDAVLGTVPGAGGLGHPRAAGAVESRVSIVFARRLLRGALDPAAFALRPASGDAVPLAVDLFYGDDSHVVHLGPGVELAPDTDHEVTVAPSLAFAEGDTLGAPFTFGFSTRLPPAPAEAPEAGCACRDTAGAPGPAALAALLALLLARRRVRG
jgi:hypothetical protein